MIISEFVTQTIPFAEMKLGPAASSYDSIAASLTEAVGLSLALGAFAVPCGLALITADNHSDTPTRFQLELASNRA